jgi:hypothetical protein
MPPEVVSKKDLRINRTFPHGLQSSFANHFVVQHSINGEVHISFFEIAPPLLVAESDEERAEMLDGLISVEAPCVARVVTTVDRMHELIAILIDTTEKYERYKQSQQSN